jgi:hypothetical protein
VHFQIEAAPAVLPELRELAEDVDEATFSSTGPTSTGRSDGPPSSDGSAPPRGSRRTRPAKVAVAPAALRFFDAETGAAICG